MDVLVVSIREKETRFAALSVSDKSITVKSVDTNRPIMASLLSENVENVAAVIADSCKRMKVKTKSLYFLLPASLVRADQWQTLSSSAMKDPKNETWRTDLDKFVGQHLVLENECPPVSRACMIRPRSGGIWVSGVAVSPMIIQNLQAAAASLKIHLVCVEPEFLGICRVAGIPQLSVIEVDSNNLYAMIFNDKKGFFRCVLPLSRTALDTDGFESVEQNLSLVDYAINQYCETVDQAHYYYYSGKIPCPEAGTRRRLNAKNLQVGIVKSRCGDMDITPYYSLLAAVKYLSANKKIEVNFPPATNLLPHVNVKAIQVAAAQKHIFAGLRAAIVLISLGLIYNFGSLAYYSLTDQTKMPQQIQKDYDNAVTEMKRLDSLMALIRTAIREDGEVVRVMDTVTSLRPASVKLSKLSIEPTGEFQIEGYSPLAEVFNLYVDTLQKHKPLISAVQLERISTLSGATPLEEKKTFLIKGSVAR